MSTQQYSELPTLPDLITDRTRSLVLDGGFGQYISDEFGDIAKTDKTLWASGLAMSYPDVIRKVHREYLQANSDIITTATYQASEIGYKKAGLAQTNAESVRVFGQTISLAIEERKAYNESNSRPVLIAVSMGSIGATLGNFSEYTGIFGNEMTKDTIVEFHLGRLRMLRDCMLHDDNIRENVDLIAFETIPSVKEAEAIAEALARINNEADVRYCHEQQQKAKIPFAWVSFSAKDSGHISHGEPIQEAIRCIQGCPYVFAVGVNCVSLEFVPELVENIRRVSTKPIVCYPNAQEWTDTQWKDDKGRKSPDQFVDLMQTSTGGFKSVDIIGGCCRTTPDHIRALSNRINY